MQSSKSPLKRRPKTARVPTPARFEALGTRWNIQLMEPVESEAWSDLLKKIRRRIEVFDKTYSRFRADSWVSEVSRRAGNYQLPPDGYALLHFYEQLYQATDGKVTPLIGQTMAAAGYDAQYSFVPGELQRPARWEAALAYNSRQLTVRQPALLDFGAAGKGYLVDIIGELIEQAGVRSYLINAGGDIRHRSAQAEALDIGLENPLNTSEALGIARLNNQSLCASAGSRRQWGKFHHIIDPVELRSPRRVLASWTIAGDTMTADGLATALFFAEPAALQKRFSFSYAVLYKDMSLRRSPDFPAAIFTAEAS
ncbi:MAG TPA: FAD:protein FMN transferase [Candidatus Saccharimonadales bacterium]|nr:FAD:protein FMN transferase [Candidatus Saccharimonadales bacterium]